MFSEIYPNILTFFTLSSVCRPIWLIEMECMAIQEAENGEFNDF